MQTLELMIIRPWLCDKQNIQSRISGISCLQTVGVGKGLSVPEILRGEPQAPEAPKFRPYMAASCVLTLTTQSHRVHWETSVLIRIYSLTRMPQRNTKNQGILYVVRAVK